MGTIGALLVAVATLVAALWVVGHPPPESPDYHKWRNR